MYHIHESYNFIQRIWNFLDFGLINNTTVSLTPCSKHINIYIPILFLIENIQTDKQEILRIISEKFGKFYNLI